jgi:hypothetical protein
MCNIAFIVFSYRDIEDGRRKKRPIKTEENTYRKPTVVVTDRDSVAVGGSNVTNWRRVDGGGWKRA